LQNEKEEFSLFGSTFIADFGEKAFHLFYESGNKLTLTEVRGSQAGRKQVLDVKIVEIRPKLFMVNWQEANKLTVTDVEDYEKGLVYANMTTPNDNFVNLQGSLKKI